jgi:hypothetical protein
VLQGASHDRQPRADHGEQRKISKGRQNADHEFERQQIVGGRITRDLERKDHEPRGVADDAQPGKLGKSALPTPDRPDLQADIDGHRNDHHRQEMSGGKSHDRIQPMEQS